MTAIDVTAQVPDFSLRPTRLGIDTHHEPVVVLRADSPVVRAEYLDARVRLEALGTHHGRVGAQHHDRLVVRVDAQPSGPQREIRNLRRVVDHRHESALPMSRVTSAPRTPF